MFTPEKELVSLEIYQKASRIDPLELDDTFKLLPDINRVADTDALLDALNHSIIQLSSKTLTTTSSLAALRDLAFLASSYVRHGRNPIEEVVGLEEAFIELGNNIGTVPRGTVATYAQANPTGERERNFTGDPEETLFIEAVRNTSLALERSLKDFIHTDAPTALKGFNNNLDVAISSIVSVMRELPPEYFTKEMRPYFEPLVIGGEKYLGAGGSQLQFVAFDYILWGATETNEMYQKYLKENYAYLTPSQKESMTLIMEKYDSRPLLEHFAISNDKVAAEAAIGALRKMKKFRYPHRKLAQDNFKVRSPGQVGSGAYTTDILDVLLERTEMAVEVAEGILTS